MGWNPKVPDQFGNINEMINMNEQKELAVSEPKKVSALEVMGKRLNLEPQKLFSVLKETVFKDASDNELAALVVVANEYGLNPLIKEIHGFKAKGGGIAPVVSVDGWINLLNRQPNYNGIEFETEEKEGKPYSTKATVYVKHRDHPTVVTEYYDECYRPTDPWNKSPRRMLRHKALIQCARVAFGFSGIYDEDEARDVAQASVEPPKAKKPIFIESEKPKETTVAPVEILPDSLTFIRDHQAAQGYSDDELMVAMKACALLAKGSNCPLEELSVATLKMAADNMKMLMEKIVELRKK